MQMMDVMAPAPRIIPDSGEAALPLDQEMVEVLLLLPSGQAAALEQAAQQRSLTVGQALRQLIRDFVAGQALTRPTPFPEGKATHCRGK